jgi:hypothetical protein
MTKRRIVIGATIAAIVAGLSVRIYLVDEMETAGPEVFWNADEAYLFIRTNRLGFRAPAALLLQPLMLGQGSRLVGRAEYEALFKR